VRTLDFIFHYNCFLKSGIFLIWEMLLAQSRIRIGFFRSRIRLLILTKWTGSANTGNKIPFIRRGLILTKILWALEQQAGRPVTQLFDWICGTSTGGILTLALALGKTTRDCQALYFRLVTALVGYSHWH
jgi:hypothetical protein